MFRTLAALVVLSLAPSVALAAEPSLDERKAEWKALDRYSKDVEKLVRGWEKAAERERADDLAELDAQLLSVGRVELERLRAFGIEPRVSLVERQPGKVPPAEHPRMQTLFEDLVALEELQARFDDGTAKPRHLREKLERLARVSENLTERAERAERRYELARAGV